MTSKKLEINSEILAYCPLPIPYSQKAVRFLTQIKWDCYISEWKNQALFHGVESLRLQLSWETRLLQSKKRKQLSG